MFCSTLSFSSLNFLAPFLKSPLTDNKTIHNKLQVGINEKICSLCFASFVYLFFHDHINTYRERTQSWEPFCLGLHLCLTAYKLCALSWASYLTFCYLDFLTCKTGILYNTISQEKLYHQEHWWQLIIIIANIYWELIEHSQALVNFFQ